MSEESELLARCRRGEPEAWNALFDAHYAAAGRFVFQLSPSFAAEDVEEICQEAFMSVVRNLSSFQGQCHFQTWLFRIAANKARDFREKGHAAKRGGGQANLSLDERDPETGLGIDPPAHDPAPDAALLGQERVQLMRQALDQLGQPCREIIELRYFGDLAYDQISAALSLNPKTVSSRLSKCLDKLEEIAKTVFAEEKTGVFPSNK